MPGFEADHSQVVKLLGERTALDLYRETVRVSELTDEIIAEENIACDSRRGYWIIDNNADKFAKLEDFLAPRRALQLPEPQLYTVEYKRHDCIGGVLGELHACAPFVKSAAVEIDLSFERIAADKSAYFSSSPPRT